MDLTEAITLLRKIYDQRELAASVNDKPTQLQHEDTAHALFQQLAVGVIGAVRSRRHAAALAARDLFDMRITHPDMVDLGQQEWTLDELRTNNGGAAARRVLARAVLDDATLPQTLRHHAAAALHQVNLGEAKSWLGRPYKIQGLKGTHAYDFYIDVTVLTRIYYYAGYHNKPLNDAIAKVLKDDPDDKRWEALRKMRGRANLTAYCEAMKAAGEQDQRDGKPFSPPVALDYDLTELEALRATP